MTAFLEARGIRLTYRDRLDLEADQVSVDRGEVLALLGASGAGKSTLLRIMGLLEKPQAGTIVLDGKRASPRSLKTRRRMASALQAPTLWRGTVFENVAYGLKLRGIQPPERDKRCEEALAIVKLQEHRRRSVRDLSGGEAQRVALARALAVMPEVLLLDEPLTHIDEPLRESLAVALNQYTSRTGCATVWVTHDRAEALGMSDRLAVIEKGKLLQSGKTTDVFARPADERVAKLVGTDNVIPGEILDSSDGIAKIGVGDLELSAVSDSGPGSKVYLLIRPEEILVWPNKPLHPIPRNRFRASVTSIVSLGAVAKLHLDAGFPLIALVTRPTLADLGVSVGSHLWVGFKATAPHVVPRT